MSTCKICGHDKSLHRVYICPDHTGEEIKHISCEERVKSEIVDFGLGKMDVGECCSCHGVKPNTYLTQAIKKYQKFLREKTDKSLVKDLYIRKQIKNAIKYFRKLIKENPHNLLNWQKSVV